MLGHHSMQRGDPGHAFGQPPTGRPVALTVLHLDVVMASAQSSPMNNPATATSPRQPAPKPESDTVRRSYPRANGSVLDRHDIPPVVSPPQPTSSGTLQ